MQSKNLNEPFYKRLPSGGFAFFIGSKEVIPYTDDITFMVTTFIDDEYMFTKHGSYENVKKIFDREAPVIRSVMKEKAYLVTFRDITDEALEEINRCLQCTGYINTMIKKYNLLDNAEQ